MTASVAQLVEKALLLPSEARNELVEALLEHSDGDGELIGEQMKLVEERMARAARGETTFVEADEAHKFVLDSLQRME